MSKIATGSQRISPRARLAVPVILALAAALIGVAAAPAAAAATGTLTITVVSDSGGAPIANTQIYVSYFDGTDWDSEPGGTTAADGTFVLSNVPAGPYQFDFFGPDSLWVPQAYDNQQNTQGAGVYNLAAGTSTLTVGLTPAATISGTVTQSGGGFPADGYVEAYPVLPSGAVGTSTSGSGSIDSAGHYTVSPLPAGQVVLRVVPPFGSSYAGQYYSNVYTPSSATQISLTTAQHRSGFDMQLAVGATISGIVTGPTSAAAVGVTVEVWQTSPEYGDFEMVKSASVNSSGAYSLSGFAPGAYSLRFNAVGTPWASEWYNDQPDPVSATPITLTGGQVLSATNAQLAAGATISGRITDAVSNAGLAGNATVERKNPDNTWESIGSAAADASGHYAVTGLSAGTYRVFLEGPGYDYAIEYSGNTFYADTAEQIVVAAGATSGSHDVALVKGVTINTYARDRSTNMLVGAIADLEIERSPGNWVKAPVVYGDGDTGFSSSSGLPPGTYRIHWVDDSGSGYVTQWWNDEPNAATANLVTLAAGGEATVTALMSTTAIPVQAVSPAPVPTISGVPQIGNTLTALPGTWGPAPVALTYQWSINGVAKSASTASTFVVGSDAVGFPVTVAVTGMKDGYTSVTQTSAATPAVAQTFADVASNAPLATEMTWMYTTGISTGYIDGSGYRIFKPVDPVTRRAMAAFLYRAASSPAFSAPASPSFSDVPTTDPFFKEIEWMKAQGISTGTANGNGTFSYKPGDPVSRQAMATFLYRSAGSPAFTPPATPSFSDVPATSSVYAQIEWMKSAGISTGTANGDGTFSYKPADPVSRQAMAAFLYRASRPAG